MIRIFSVEFWMMVLFFINFFLVLFVFAIIRKMNQLRIRPVPQSVDSEGEKENDPVRDTASDIIDMLEPLVRDSRDAAIQFEEQIKDKKRLLKGLNDALDSRIININLLLSRADAMQKKIEERQAESGRIFAALPREEALDIPTGNAANHQDQILNMYNRKYDIDTIAQRLSIPKGEVQLVVDLKKKFLEMEKNSR
ncbi:MAG: hypothetical protein A2277_15480 [Desulfobacterales bacterium RIFOXYA12_FULL_46_15]|nr:MAG: hypothetical protein A2277_15480 [Desulfobacterales bacterium RIFOXYA12_FULL_46_15]